MKVYKLEVAIVDHDNIGGEGIKDVLENTRYPNRCISPKIIDIKEVDIGEWDDNHPLNNRRLFIPYFKKLFPNPEIKLNYLRGVLRRALKSDGCFDGSCILRENHGMTTNGGCGCLKDLQYTFKRKEKRQE